MFGKEKESKEFFEVFKKQERQEGTKYNSKIFQRKQENPTVIPKIDPKKIRKSQMRTKIRNNWAGS